MSRSHRRKAFAAALMLVTGLFATAAQAQGPQPYNEPGPGKGGWNLEYTGQLAWPGTSVKSSSVELLYGLTDRLALSLEAEAEREGNRIGMDELAIGATWSLNGAAPVEASLFAQAAVNGAASLSHLEAGFAARHESETWRTVVNVGLRWDREEASSCSLTYALFVDREIVEHLRIGVAASGQPVRLSGAADAFEGGHYVGPSVAATWDRGSEGEVEIGLGYMRRLGSDASEGALQLRAEIEL